MVDKQLDIFGNEMSIREIDRKEKQKRKRYRTMQEMYGVKEGQICKTCKHCIDCGYHGRTYYKCELWFRSHSSATDIRLRDTACNRWESEEIQNGGEENKG